MNTLEKACVAARTADAMKNENIVVLDVTGLCNFTDYFVVATCSASTLLRGTAHRIERDLREAGERPFADNLASTAWMLLDYGDLVVHLFTPEARKYYRLEELWEGAKICEWAAPANA